jgi:predicted O-methyltransferase YrrM
VERGRPLLADKLILHDPGPSHDHAVSRPQGALLERLARAIGPRAIREIGTLEGVGG